jgi:hypothetical protein
MRVTRPNCQADNEQPRRPHPYLLRQIFAAASDGGSYTLLSFRADTPVRLGPKNLPGPETAKNRIRNENYYGAEASGWRFS